MTDIDSTLLKVTMLVSQVFSHIIRLRLSRNVFLCFGIFDNKSHRKQSELLIQVNVAHNGLIISLAWKVKQKLCISTGVVVNIQIYIFWFVLLCINMRIEILYTLKTKSNNPFYELVCAKEIEKYNT